METLSCLSMLFANQDNINVVDKMKNFVFSSKKKLSFIVDLGGKKDPSQSS